MFTPVLCQVSVDNEPDTALVPSPSDVPRFLQYCEDELGIAGAMAYQSPLSRKRYGPDILADVTDEDLSKDDVGIPPGDVIRLKRGSVKWWNLSSGGKRKAGSRSSSHHDSHRGQKSRRTWSPEPSAGTEVQVRYEEKFPEGGGHTFWAGPLKQTTDLNVSNPNLYYYSDAFQEMVEVPPGYVPPVAAYTDPV